MCRTRMQIDLIDALRRVLAVHELQITPLVEPFDQLHRFDYGLRDALDPQFDWKLMGRTLLESTPERALLLMEGTFGMRYFIFRMPDEQDKAYIIGSWRSAASREQLQKNLEWFGVRTSQQMRDLVENFYGGIYLMEDESLFGQTVLSLLSAAFPHVDGREDFHIEMRKELLPFNFTAVDLGETHLEASAGLSRTMLEERYNNESDLMDAVAQGDIEKAMKIVERHRRFRYSDDRFFNDLQELRNSLIVLNVLLRKSIQRAEVHPCYIDTLSAGYYQRIRTVTVEQVPALREEMLVGYCRCVQEYALRNYSPLIRSVINCINLNLAESLSLRALAEQFFISQSYLSNLFRSEVGVTLVEYINSSRMKRAAGMLTESNLSITAIAEKVGIYDVNYFTKIFKKAYQMTPTLYRRVSREQSAQLAPKPEAEKK